MPVSHTFTFNTDALTAKGKEALGRAINRVADDGAHACKDEVNVDTHTLQLSCHSASVDYDGSGDFVRPKNHVAQIGDLQEDDQLSWEQTITDGVCFGSWVPYAEDQDSKTGFLDAAAATALPKFPDYFQEELENIQ